ncbi:MAG TPA: CHAT domain-containing protein [Thermoanaerobaculia bacterium]|jgi:tetratricopeptide (TPR) repeat protein|nr:CHAT domain-containing protein [Thermoanaerobaculia bacterium]
MKYHRFRLLITPGPTGGYAVHAFTPKGEGKAHFERPFPQGHADVSLAALWRAAQVERDLHGHAAAPELSPEAIGERLFEALFQGEILRLYERSLDLLQADSKGLRLELTLDPLNPDLAALQAFPWELMRQPGTPKFLTLSRRSPVTRFLTVPQPVNAAPLPHPLRILTVAASPRHPESSLPLLDLDKELGNLREAVGTANVITPEASTLAALRKALPGCHVLHFMGHGGSSTAQAEKVLFFEAEDGSEAPIRGEDLVNTIADSPTLRLVVLNACKSAMVPQMEFDAFAGVANTLVLGGMPAVVAMQHSISDAAAITFSRAFYQHLSAGDPVDAAVTEGRKAVHSANPAGMEWATPVLFMRTPTGELYPEEDLWDDPSARRKRARRLTAAFLALFLVVLVVAALAACRWRVERLVAEGATLSEHRQWKEAGERFQAALKLAPGSAEVLSDLAGAEENLGDFRAAEDHYREAVQRQPESAEHLYNLGHFLNSRTSYDEAYRFLQAAVNRDPQRADTYGDLAEAAAARGMLGKARLFLGAALGIDPERPALYRRLGELELDAGNPQAALSHLNEAIRRYPLGDLRRVETTWLLAAAYDRLENIPAACHEISEIHRLDPPGITPWAQKAEAVAARRGCRRES